jgi:hypothetical protein
MIRPLIALRSTKRAGRVRSTISAPRLASESTGLVIGGEDLGIDAAPFPVGQPGEAQSFHATARSSIGSMSWTPRVRLLRESAPWSTVSRSAASSMSRVIGPGVSSVGLSGNTPKVLTRPMRRPRSWRSERGPRRRCGPTRPTGRPMVRLCAGRAAPGRDQRAATNDGPGWYRPRSARLRNVTIGGIATAAAIFKVRRLLLRDAVERHVVHCGAQIQVIVARAVNAKDRILHVTVGGP